MIFPWKLTLFRFKPLLEAALSSVTWYIRIWTWDQHKPSALGPISADDKLHLVFCHSKRCESPSTPKHPKPKTIILHCLCFNSQLLGKHSSIINVKSAERFIITRLLLLRCSTYVLHKINSSHVLAGNGKVSSKHFWFKKDWNFMLVPSGDKSR